jgi:hypothetical protein
MSNTTTPERGYWLRVVARAWKDTSDDKTASTLSAIGGAAVGLILQYGRTITPKNTWEAVGIPLASGFTGFLILLFARLVSTPRRLDEESGRHIHKLETELEVEREKPGPQIVPEWKPRIATGGTGGIPVSFVENSAITLQNAGSEDAHEVTIAPIVAGDVTAVFPIATRVPANGGKESVKPSISGVPAAHSGDFVIFLIGPKTITHFAVAPGEQEMISEVKTALRIKYKNAAGKWWESLYELQFFPYTNEARMHLQHYRRLVTH